MKYSGAEIIIKLLEEQGIDKISGIPGGTNLPIYDALNKSSKIQHILTRHEQGAGFMAQGIARTTGKAAVCFATSGPGVTNLLTAIADAKLDSVPMVAITGQVPSSLLGTDAFQEVDTCGLAIPITKHNFFVRSAKELFHIIPEAFKVAETGRPGPVVIDVPKDVQLEKIEVKDWPARAEGSRDTNVNKVNLEDIKKMAQMINSSKKPLLYIGGGILQSNSHELLYQVAKKNNIPVASTLMGLGCFPADDNLHLGMLGMHGAPYTNLILNETDLLIAFGVRFDDRATGRIAEFCPNAAILHVDIDPAELDKNKQTSFSIAANIYKVLEELIPLLRSDCREDWICKIEEIKEKHPFSMPAPNDLGHPVNVIRRIGDLVDEDTIIATDVGQHQMWVAQVYPFKKPRRLLTSGGLGTMGFGLPTAIGAALANPDKKVVCITGDGSFLMNIQELATLADLNLNITVIILNNGALGMVRQQQELFFQANYIASSFVTNPDFASIATHFGVKGYDFKISGEMEVLKNCLSATEPCVINVPIACNENVMPIVPPGAANYQMMMGGKQLA
ncbi:biosynthetic-type acetolactate synthase large subunit [Clostridium formicaceticum]|uniref:Acetolactate synthase n=1 Tax=Clostridium formicaceticum TaxID=1497 RepID=A0AAC9RJD9_9CLOT|nr:biosynthetic-type acetolactate synthase large subunit [Clostridium formicaceticum]AOY77624.1 acetolactate synthase, large subunit, biosynthetic type [Clostridium formicaceticum]ARE88206.1 Acetolactate synthase isozyme 1 large subunit [Clostridium formicaceticum]